MGLLMTFFYFTLYSFIGWVMEVGYWLLKEGYFINRGFFLGPFCTMYGFGTLFIVNALGRFKDHPKKLFLLGVSIAAVLEQTTSYLLEKLLNIWLWDYSYSQWNINGRLSVKNLILFGILSIVLVKYIHPKVVSLSEKLPKKMIAAYMIAIAVYFSADLFVTLTAIDRLNVKLDSQAGLHQIIEERKEVLNGLILKKPL